MSVGMRNALPDPQSNHGCLTRLLSQPASWDSSKKFNGNSHRETRKRLTADTKMTKRNDVHLRRPSPRRTRKMGYGNFDTL
ncbi:hypothetical protein CEXT_2931 [Caerostris extrusa]|uniref:Uncharacterized protein n=1 Tax=Caerostris extrusa TaxID=172846 RepID=A0AAV4VIS4_CAEEX|nr:hypothetical protein CEXT_2931 [Caerostris extrusa]